MSQFRMPIRIVLYQENGEWIAHCLELDLVGHGRTREEACRSLLASLNAKLDFHVRHRDISKLFSPAPAEFFEMFAAGKDVATADWALDWALKPNLDFLIEGVTPRERDESSEHAHLVNA